MPRLFLLFCAASIAAAQPPGIILSASPARVKLSEPVTLSAIVAPPPAGGKVTFYDGAAILGVSTLDDNGIATFVARTLPAGARSVAARLWPDPDRPSISSNPVTVTVTATNAATFTQAPGSPFSLGPSPFPVPVNGDFNNDGHLDLATLDDTGVLTIWLGAGRGNFQRAGQDYATKVSYGTPVCGDFDGDGNVDLAITSDQSVFVFLGNGIGGFQTAPGSPYGVGDTPVLPAVGDFNGDGKADLAISHYDVGSVTIMLGDGSGGFAVSKVAPGSAPAATGIGVADFNLDGKPDLALVFQEPAAAVRVLLGDGKGGFSTAGDPAAVGKFPYGLVVADFDGDGKPDIAVASQLEDTVTTAFGNGAGGFDATKGGARVVGRTPQTLATGDFNGDGLPDIAVASVDSGTVSLLISNGRGGFVEPRYSPLTVRANGQVIVADFNEDGAGDIVALDYFTSTAAVLQGSSGLTIAAENGAFAAGKASVFRLTVANRALGRTEGTVLVTDRLPASLTPRTADGPGWACSVSGPNVACTRSDALGPGESYPQIAVVVDVGTDACPSVLTVAEVVQATRSAVTVTTPVSGCFQVAQNGGPFIVNQPGSYVVQLTPIAGVASAVTVTDVLPAGLTPVSASGSGWNCGVAGQNVSCVWQPRTPAAAYTPITIGLNVGEPACRTSPNGGAAQNLVLVQAAEGPQETFPRNVGAVGCILVRTPDTFAVIPGGVFGGNVVVTSAGSSRETITNAEVLDSAVFSAPLGGCGDLNPGTSCGIAILVQMPCPGSASGTLTLSTASGASYKVPLRATSAPRGVEFLVDGRAGVSTLTPFASHTVSLRTDPVLDASCPQPQLSAIFFPTFKDDAHQLAPFFWDNAFDGKTLHVGTVAGTIYIGGEYADKSTALPSSQFAVPASKGVVTDLAISNRTTSSFQLDVKGFSTPRETGDSARTAVCVEFIAANGASVTNKSQPCALQSEIEIWYERSVSYQWGSQFSGSIIYTFAGDTSAIDTVKAWIRNMVGDGTPVCVNLKTGTKGTCPN
jgi:uncharacterized repeat protein (TIGR01451 family)